MAILSSLLTASRRGRLLLLQNARKHDAERLFTHRHPAPIAIADGALNKNFHDKAPELPINEAPGLTLSKVKGELKSTLLLPRTPFQLRAEAYRREHLFTKRTTKDLYQWQAAQKDRPLFVLHDGPPYANGDLHMGHALNKIIKDIVNRYKVLQGNRVHYFPGWDCHGMPIENKVYGLPEFQKTKKGSEGNALRIRTASREMAAKAISTQKDSFQRYGIMADWSDDTTYKTYDETYVRRQLRIMREMVRRGLIYRAKRPVHWSPSSGTALAESELEYPDNFFSRSVYVRFPLQIGPGLRAALQQKSMDEREVTHSGNDINALIWTTTPWTLPSNMFMTVNRELSYSLVRTQEGPSRGELIVCATERINALQKLKMGLNSACASQRPLLGSLEILCSFPGSALLDSTYRHPYLPNSEEGRPILEASYVTASTGTGLVHGAPGHGHEDYDTWIQHCKENADAKEEEILSPVDHRGRFLPTVRKIERLAGNLSALASLRKSRDNGTEQQSGEGSEGQLVYTGGDARVIKDLHAYGALLSEIRIQHKFAHDWRTGKPVIVRLTSQWFTDLQDLKKQAIQALDKVRFVPEFGKARLQKMLQDRNGWCISRQRSWGVPIPVLYNDATDEPLMSMENIEHIERILAEKGLDFWWKGEAEVFVAPPYRREGVRWRKGGDIIDVWFDSGSSWNILPGAQAPFESEGALQVPDVPVADVYLEGVDQYRGWFQSSLLTYIATANQDKSVVPSAPYKTVMSHGFIVDKRGDKMSKSKGNVLSPDFFIEGGPKKTQIAFGTDVLRMWAARGDPQTDITISELVVKHASEALRKLRTTCRFLLSVLPRRGEAPSLDGKALGLLERWIMNELYTLDFHCRQAYDDFDFAQVVRRVSEFSNSAMSSLYMDISKDVLYSDPINSERRQVTIAILDQALRTMSSILAPITPHLAEEIHHFYDGAHADPTASDVAESVFQHGWQHVPEQFKDETATSDFGQIMAFRSALLAELELGRQKKLFNASLEVDVDILLDESSSSETSNDAEAAALQKVLQKYAEELSNIFLVSHVTLVDDLSQLPDSEGKDFVLPGHCRDTLFWIRPSRGMKCSRCWTYRRTRADTALCPRCQSAVEGAIEHNTHARTH